MNIFNNHSFRFALIKLIIYNFCYFYKRRWI
nr:MAG TPA: hypothetical protein [Caudoviricetes sp.]